MSTLPKMTGSNIGKQLLYRCFPALITYAIVLWVSRGFPPASWVLLAQTITHFSSLASTQGTGAIFSLLGILLQALLVGLAWIVSIVLVIRECRALLLMQDGSSSKQHSVKGPISGQQSTAAGFIQPRPIIQPSYQVQQPVTPVQPQENVQILPQTQQAIGQQVTGVQPYQSNVTPTTFVPAPTQGSLASSNPLEGNLLANPFEDAVNPTQVQQLPFSLETSSFQKDQQGNDAKEIAQLPSPEQLYQSSTSAPHTNLSGDLGDSSEHRALSSNGIYTDVLNTLGFLPHKQPSEDGEEDVTVRRSDMTRIQSGQLKEPIQKNISKSLSLNESLGIVDERNQEQPAPQVTDIPTFVGESTSQIVDNSALGNPFEGTVEEAQKSPQITSSPKPSYAMSDPFAVQDDVMNLFSADDPFHKVLPNSRLQENSEEQQSSATGIASRSASLQNGNQQENALPDQSEQDDEFDEDDPFVFGNPFSGPLPEVFHHDEDLKRSIVEQTGIEMPETPVERKRRRSRKKTAKKPSNE